MTREDAKHLVLKDWLELPAGERTRERAASFAVESAKKYPFDSANPVGVIRVWLLGG